MDIDKYLDEIGTFGPWHLWVFSWIFLMVFFNAGVNIAIVFMNEIPDFVCKNHLFSALANRRWSFGQIKQFSCPVNDKGVPNCCYQYKMNYTEMAESTFSQALVKYGNLSSNAPVEVEKCPGPWIWDLTGMDNTAVTQWSLVCDESVNIANMQLVYMMGFFFACSSFGIIADRFGRRITSTIALGLTGIFGIADSLMLNFYGFLFLRFFVGFFNSGSAQCLYVLALELCNEKLRKVMGAIFFVFYSFGYVGLAGIAFAVRDWRIMHIITSAPCCLGILLFWFIPESPRWLASQRKIPELKTVMQWAAKWNGKEKISLKFMDIQKEKNMLINGEVPVREKHATPDKLAFFKIFFHPRLSLRALNIFFNWFVNAMVYYGISLLITSFSGNIFVNNAISGALETPAYLLCYPLLWWARKKSLMITLILAGISGLMYLAVPPNVVWAQLLLAFIAKLCITASFNLVFVVTLELYPTKIRGTSLLFSSMAGRIGSIAAPYITLIAQTNKDLMSVPMVIYGISALIAGFLTCFIPESQGQPLPETLEDILHYPPKKKEPL